MKWLSIIILILLFIGLSFLVIARFGLKGETSKQPFSSEVISVHGGFGYQILNGEKILIRQEFIPAVQGEKPFLIAKDAKSIGELVVHKLTNGETPVIHIEEIEKFNIELQ